MVFLLLLLLSSLCIACCCVHLAFGYAGTSLSIGGLKLGIRHFTLTDLAVSVRLYDLQCTLRSLTIQLCFPTTDMPRWCELTAVGYTYKDPLNHVTSSLTTATFWFFPTLLSSNEPKNLSQHGKRIGTDGSLLTSEIEDFRVLVYTSTAMPMWVDRLRKNVMFGIFNGTHVRADHLETHINTSIDSSSSPTTSDLKGAVHEARITVSANEWHVYNPLDDRLYCFGELDAQVRRIWDREEGTFVLIAKACTWVHSPKEPDNIQLSLYKHFFRSIMSLPIELKHLYNSIWSTLDVHITRVDISFDHFRLRDAEFTYQLGSLLGNTWDGVKGTGFVEDTIARAVHFVGEKRANKKLEQKGEREEELLEEDSQ